MQNSSLAVDFPEGADSLAVETGWGILGFALRGRFPWCLLLACCLLGRSVLRSALQWKMRMIVGTSASDAKHPSAVV